MRQVIGLTLPELFFFKFTLGVMPGGNNPVQDLIYSKTECSTAGDGLIQSGIPVGTLHLDTVIPQDKKISD